MNIALERLLEGIVATLRNDVIPHVGDAYARGQAVGVIDLINDVGPRIEWARAPLIETVSEKIALLSAVATLLPGVAAPHRSGRRREPVVGRTRRRARPPRRGDRRRAGARTWRRRRR